MTSPAATEKRVPALDAMRFAAAFAVMTYHYTYSYSTAGGPPLSALQAVTRHGYLGVELFFVISGFVILWSAQARTVPGFARARLLRLYPEFWLSVLISAFAFGAVPGGFPAPDRVLDVGLNLTMLPQYLGAQFVDGVYWTLGVEIKFYVLVAAIIAIGQIRQTERWIYAWLATLVLATFVDVGGIVRSLTIFPYGSYFAAGGLFYLVHEQGWSRTRAAGVVCSLGLGAWHAVERMDGFIDVAHITAAGRLATVAIIVGIFASFTLLVGRNVGARWTASLATLGALTYPLYLLHNVGKELFLVGLSGAPKVLTVPAAVGFSLAIAYGVTRLAGRFVQPPLRALLDRLGLRQQRAIDSR